jgi:hypothetical protein
MPLGSVALLRATHFMHLSALVGFCLRLSGVCLETLRSRNGGIHQVRISFQAFC